MADWDTDSPQLRANLLHLLQAAQISARLRSQPTVATAKQWHRELLTGLAVPDPAFVGAFRGEPGLEDVEVQLGDRFGAAAEAVGVQLQQFQAGLQRSVAALDALIPPASLPNEQQLSTLLDLWAWTHAEWVRIHPFAGGNGRIARLWVNWLAMRYSLPPFLRLRPRPDSGYTQAGLQAMAGDWRSTIPVLRQSFYEFVATL